MGISNSQKGNSNPGKVPDSFVEALRKIGPQSYPEDSLTKLKNRQELLDRRHQKQFLHRLERVKQEEKQIYSHKERELRVEVETLREEVAKALGTIKKVEKQADVAAAQPIVEPGPYHLNFLIRLRSLVLKLIEMRKNMNESAEWLAAWNQKSKKKGFFWSTFASKKGGGKFLLSSEHYLTRSAG